MPSEPPKQSPLATDKGALSLSSECPMRLWRYRRGEDHGAGHRVSGLVTSQYPYYLEGELDGGTRALAGDQAMGFIGHDPRRAQLCRGQTGLKARMAGGARIPQQAVMVQYHGGCGADGGAPAAEACLLP